MKCVTPEYIDSMRDGMRDRSFVRILFDNINTAAQQDGAWVPNGQTSWSDPALLDHRRDFGRTPATLELNWWELGGNVSILPDPDADDDYPDDGFISSHMSDEEGILDEPVVLRREFAEQHSLYAITLLFHTRIREWPKEMTVRFLTPDGEPDIECNLEELADIQAVSYARHQWIHGIEITFHALLPHRRPRLEHVLFGLTEEFTNDDIESVTQKKDVDPLTRRLPQETFSFTIFDFDGRYNPAVPAGIYQFIDTRAPISIQYGYELSDRVNGTEWLAADNYVLDSKPSVQNGRVTFRGTGVIGSLNRTFYKDTVGRKSFYDMAERVLQDLDLPPRLDGTDPWEVDESLRRMFTTAVLPIDTHMNCLQLIAHACRCKLFTSGDNVIHIVPFEVGEMGQPGQFVEEFDLDFTTVKLGSERVQTTDHLRAVEISRYSHIEEDRTTLFEGEVSGGFVHIPLSDLARGVGIEIMTASNSPASDNALEKFSIYGRAVDLELALGTWHVTITGIPLQESEAQTTVSVNARGEVDTIQNPLITSEEMANALAEHHRQYLRFRNSYDCDCRGNPEVEPSDVILQETQFVDKIKALVLKNEVSFNGALSGKMRTKALTTDRLEIVNTHRGLSNKTHEQLGQYTHRRIRRGVPVLHEPR